MTSFRSSANHVVFALSDCDCVRGCKPSECFCDGFFACFLEVFSSHIS